MVSLNYMCVCVCVCVFNNNNNNNIFFHYRNADRNLRSASSKPRPWKLNVDT